MNKSIILKITASFIAVAMLSNCNSPEKKMENAGENVTEAKEELVNANEDYKAEIENYKIEKAKEFANNELSIIEFNKRISQEKKETLEAYKKKIADLNQKNSDLKLKMENYKIDGKEKWEAFKVEYNHDMEELEKAFKDLSTNNIK